jgi:hypothetical protein
MGDKFHAVHYMPGRIKRIRGIGLHTTQGQEIPKQARTVAAWFSDPKRSPRSSAHFVVDNFEAIRLLPDSATAWAVPNFNADGLHIEMVGIAGQSAKEWADPYSLAVMDRAAHIAATWIKIYDLRNVRLTQAEILDRKSTGLFGHGDASKAFKTPGGHSDPGPEFPYGYFLTRVKHHIINPLTGGKQC